MRYRARMQLSPQQVTALQQTADRFLAANRVSLVVGLVMTPLLFGGIGVGLWAAIPAPFGMWIGGALLAAGGLMMVFLLWYRHQTLKKLPFVAWAVIGQWRVMQGRHGAQAFSVDVQIEQAYPLSPQGFGAELARYRGQGKTLTLTSRNLFQTVQPGYRTLLLCMPTEEVVAIDSGRQLITA